MVKARSSLPVENLPCKIIMDKIASKLAEIGDILGGLTSAVDFNDFLQFSQIICFRMLTLFFKKN